MGTVKRDRSKSEKTSGEGESSFQGCERRNGKTGEGLNFEEPIKENTTGGE